MKRVIIDIPDEYAGAISVTAGIVGEMKYSCLNFISDLVITQ